ncbi:MAG TPA: sulfotransferase, partial [Mycobacterium sp.]
MGSAGPDIADIDFDDLTSPRLTDIQRQVLEFTEAKRVELDIDRMFAEAVEQAGVGDDLDDCDGFTGRLAVHVAAIEADDGLRELTRSTLRQRVVR